MKMENTSVGDKMGLGQASEDIAVSQGFPRHLRNRLKKITCWITATLLFLTYNVYLGFSLHHSWLLSSSWCHDVRLLVLLTVIVYGSIVYYVLLKQWLFQPLINFFIGCFRRMPYSGTGWIVLYLGIGIFLIVDTRDNRARLISAGGLVVLVALGYVFSAHRTKVKWRQVLWGSTLQFVFGLLILRWDVGQEIFSCLGDKVKTFLEFTDFGSTFVFGYLITGKMDDLPVQPAPFAFKILCVILFFSFCTSVLYYCGIMQRLVINIGWFLQKTVGTTSCESMNAAGNIFLGQTEAPLLIQPYLPLLTKSEIHAVMTGGFASIAGSVMAAFISFGVSPSHLLSASVMSAPAALAYSKLFYPETEESRTDAKNISIEKGKEHNVLEAATNGVSSAIPLVANIAANLIAFIAFLRFLDSSLTWFGSLIGWDFITFEWLLSKIFVPLAFIMGVPWIDCQEVSRLIGIKTTVNEFVAYAELGKLIEKQTLTPRSEAIATYALCGFSNISAIGIQLGALGTLAPSRKNDIARVAVRAMIAGSAACFMTACIAGTLLDEPINSTPNFSEWSFSILRSFNDVRADNSSNLLA